MPDMQRKQHASESTGKLKRRGGSPEVPRSREKPPTSRKAERRTIAPQATNPRRSRGVRAIAIDPVQEQVRRPAVRVGHGAPVAVLDAAIGDRVPDVHGQ